MSMRIVGGMLGGRRLKAPRGMETRPTAERVREAMFNILGAPPPRAHVLDLFAGAGTLGLEALSRGAARAVFVERSRAAVRCLTENAAALGVDDMIKIHCADATRSLARLEREGERFDWLFVDPPYRNGHAERALALLGASELVLAGGVVVAEADRREPFAQRYGRLSRESCRRYGDTQVLFFRPEAG
jgi:16S rRNA (guanine(966)-N(2))-methyltransferase RsmD